MKARLLKMGKVQELYSSIEDNLDRYRNGNFDFLTVDSSCYIETKHEIDDSKLSEIRVGEDGLREVENCLIMHEAMGNLSFYLARDSRLWVYLAHTNLLSYSRTRWEIPTDDKQAVKQIQRHLFIKGARDFERDNSASRLWWMASLCSRSSDLSKEEALECILYRSDVRANIIERPTISQNISVFYSILLKLHESLKGDKSLFEREKFRSLMRELNLRGGVKLLGVMGLKEIGLILDDLA